MAKVVKVTEGDRCPLCLRGKLHVQVTPRTHPEHSPVVNHFCDWCQSVIDCIATTGFLTSMEFQSLPIPEVK